MFSRYTFLSVIIALSLTGLLSAADRTDLCGRTLDTSSEVIANASVTVYGRDTGVEAATESDSTGRYCFAHLANGSYLLQAKAASLALAKPQLIIVNSSTTALPDLSLSIASVSTQVTVIGSGLPQLTSETSKALDVIDVPEANKMGKNLLLEAIREIPGFRTSQRGGPGSFSSIQIRGLRTFDTSLLIDGVRFRDVAATQSDASSFLSDLWFTDTSRVEVLRGAGASLYGTNAIGGVINLVTDQGGGRLHGGADLQGGMLGQFRGRAHIAGGALRDRLFYSMGGGHFNVTEGLDGDDRYRNTGGLGSVDFVLTPKIRTGVRVLGADVFGQLNTNPSGVPSPTNLPLRGPVAAVPLAPNQIPAALNGLPYTNGNATFIPAVDDADYYRTTHFVSTLLSWQHAVTPTFSYRANYQILNTARDYVDGPSGLGFYQPPDRTSDKYNARIDTAGVIGDWRPVASQLLSAGYEFEREFFDTPSYVGQQPVFLSGTQVSQRSHSVFAQDQMRLFQDRLQISLSGRWQGFDLSAPQFSGVFPVYASATSAAPPSALTGDASIAYFIRTSNTKIRSHVGNAYRAPSLYERFGTSFYDGYFSAYGDPRLSPERAISLDGGIDQYFAQDKLKISATYFYTRLQETIGFDFSGIVNPVTDPFGRYGGYFNTHGGIARGVELSAEAKVKGGLLIRSSYTYTGALDRVSQYGDGTLQTPRIFPHSFTFEAQRSFGRHWDSSFDFIAASHYLYPFDGLPNRFEGPRQANVSVGYTHPLAENRSLRIYTRLENINDQTLYEDGFPTPGFVARGGFQFSF